MGRPKFPDANHPKLIIRPLRSSIRPNADEFPRAQHTTRTHRRTTERQVPQISSSKERATALQEVGSCTPSAPGRTSTAGRRFTPCVAPQLPGIEASTEPLPSFPASMTTIPDFDLWKSVGSHTQRGRKGLEGYLLLHT